MFFNEMNNLRVAEKYYPRVVHSVLESWVCILLAFSIDLEVLFRSKLQERKSNQFDGLAMATHLHIKEFSRPINDIQRPSRALKSLSRALRIR